MHSQSIYEFRPTAVRTATASSRSSFIPGRVVSICNSPAFIGAIEEERTTSNRDGLGCARGIRAAFALEGGAALLLYGVWHLWHLVH